MFFIPILWCGFWWRKYGISNRNFESVEGPMFRMKLRQMESSFMSQLSWFWGDNINKKQYQLLLAFFIRRYDFKHKKNNKSVVWTTADIESKTHFRFPHTICPNPHKQINFLLRVHGLGFKHWIKSGHFDIPHKIIFVWLRSQVPFFHLFLYEEVAPLRLYWKFVETSETVFEI